MEKTNKEIEEIFYKIFGVEISGWLSNDMITISGRKDLIDLWLKESV